ncbi:hypothetical protein GIB67_009279 [Kingdonia uniflora]|uniref:COP9 signalosome complex subunit 3 n=1 Tax=Kingdonia uniflora TaxID=39325 RepID=A0A7J7N2Z6_9MAGN|nr:hypothetical protein GIB67_009279 [Kingdonia uniflora]
MQKALAGIKRIKLEGLRWRVFDAKDQILGRLASQISTVIQGKDKPTYAPHREEGDMCIVLNAKDISVTGKKLTNKFYRWHTGYIGHLKERSLKDQLTKDPTEVIRKAVLRMLPRNKLRDDRDLKLRIFTGSEHPFGDRPLEPYIMPPRQVRELRPRVRRAMIRAQKKQQNDIAHRKDTNKDENEKLLNDGAKTYNTVASPVSERQTNTLSFSEVALLTGSLYKNFLQARIKSNLTSLSLCVLMDSLEALVAHIQGFSSNFNDLSHLHSLLKQSDDSLRYQANRLAPVLDQLDPSKHSLGYLFILEAVIPNSSSKQKAGELVPIVVNFIDSCVSDQIRLAPEKFISVCKRFKDDVILLGAPIRGVASMRTAVQKLRPSSEHLTALHPDFLLLCILAKCYKAGLGMLEEDDIFEVDQPRNLFLYCYYGGMICIGQKRFGKALELLKNVFTAPMNLLNAITVEAYKKYILISLIHNGQFSTTLPKYTSSIAGRHLKNYSQDNNVGLVKQVVSSLYKRNIQRLTQTYLTLSFQDIASTAQLSTPKEAEMHVLQMIQDGEIFATINQKDGMVSFHEDPEQYKSCEMIDHIDSSIQRIITLSKKLSAVDELMSCDSSYLSKAARDRHRGYDLDDFEPLTGKFNL